MDMERAYSVTIRLPFMERSFRFSKPARGERDKQTLLVYAFLRWHMLATVCLLVASVSLLAPRAQAHESNAGKLLELDALAVQNAMHAIYIIGYAALFYQSRLLKYWYFLALADGLVLVAVIKRLALLAVARAWDSDEGAATTLVALAYAATYLACVSSALRAHNVLKRSIEAEPTHARALSSSDDPSGDLLPGLPVGSSEGESESEQQASDDEVALLLSDTSAEPSSPLLSSPPILSPCQLSSSGSCETADVGATSTAAAAAAASRVGTARAPVLVAPEEFGVIGVAAEDAHVQALQPSWALMASSRIARQCLYAELCVSIAMQGGSVVAAWADPQPQAAASMAHFVEDYTGGIHRALVLTMAMYGARYLRTEPALMYMMANVVLAPSLVFRALSFLAQSWQLSAAGLAGLALFGALVGAKLSVVWSLFALRRRLLRHPAPSGERLSGEIWGGSHLHPPGTSLLTLGRESGAHLTAGGAVVVGGVLWLGHCLALVSLRGGLVGLVLAANFAAHGFGWYGWSMYHAPRVHHAVHFVWRKRFYSTLALTLCVLSVLPLAGWLLAGAPRSGLELASYWLVRSGAFAVAGLALAVMRNVSAGPAAEPLVNDDRPRSLALDALDMRQRAWYGASSSAAAGFLGVFVVVVMCASGALGWLEGGWLSTLAEAEQHSGAYDLAYHFCLLVGGFGVRGVLYSHDMSLYGTVLGGLWAAAIAGWGCGAGQLAAGARVCVGGIGLAGLAMAVSHGVLQQRVRRAGRGVEGASVW
ncbi:uncharacterized protein AMSG_00661 [Thecamonas trahens ATCC 50062]|uniref:Uncharacterized protein n=1 Tax=Thecamonas trahens ATCC 50062 TaxID=461836 RepID=A0A0L0DE40_THETB|nr:hypothetical protein AMSG_00661 [Thecamonas trahens ATCC 50062]KNC50500.1 hypothetical protein AMSG_00661 [Thecamonas trahens ATCC 50062]|eukprot:XP_013762393.1 hypothetical protein AMSG_00661 [Thecamonas trahens ATCC 50062]